MSKLALDNKVDIKEVRKNATITGLSLLAIAILSIVANYGILGNLNQGNYLDSLEAISQQKLAITFATVLLTAIIALDGAVLVGLVKFLNPSKSRLVRIMGWSRVVYVAIFLIAITFLVSTITRIGNGTASISAAALSDIKGFHIGWDIALVIFGLHLTILGLIFYRTTYTPTWLGILLVIAGIGYIINSITTYLIGNRIPEISTLTFIGEAILIFWLLGWGSRVKIRNSKK